MTRQVCYLLFGVAMLLGVGWTVYAERYGDCTHDQIDTIMKKCNENPEVIDDLYEALEDQHISYGEAEAIIDKYSSRYHQRRRSGDFFRRGKKVCGRYHLRTRVGRFFG